MKPFHSGIENHRRKYITPAAKRETRIERDFLAFIAGFICGGLTMIAVIMLSFF